VSARCSIRANGVPGGAFALDTSGSSQLIPSLVGDGIVALTVDFSLHSGLPESASSLDEPHWLFSFHDRFLFTEIISVGVTPAGQLAMNLPGIPVILTTAGTIQPDGARHTLLIEWDGGIGYGTYSLDGAAEVDIGDGTSPAFCIPSTVGQIALLNGGRAQSKFHAAVYRASTLWLDSSAKLVTVAWELTEGAGDTINATVTKNAIIPSDMFDGFDLNLYRQWLVGYPSPWPTDTSGDPGETSSWVIKTQYRRRTRTATRYRRRRVSWLS